MDDGTKKGLGIAVGVSSSVGFLWGMDPELVKSFLSETAQSQVAQAGFFFTLAYWLHAGRVKKEISKSFTALIAAIDSVSQALRKDLEAQQKLLADHGKRLETLEKQKPI